jgi:hypothetical protein
MTAPVPWTPREVEHLESIAGDYPRLVVFDMHRNWLLRNRLPTRTNDAIEFVANARGISLAARGAVLTPYSIATVLGISCHRVDRWLYAGLIPFCRLGELEHKRRRYVRRRDLVAFAKEHPYRFHGISKSRLCSLLEDPELAASIAANYPPMPRKPRRVQCVETLNVYPSARQAASAAFISRQRIFSALKTGGTAGGYHWRDVIT